MAYWGEQLCYNHPLFARSPDNDNPRAVLARLGSSWEARLAKAPTDREKGLLRAVGILCGEGEYNDRRVAYMDAMRQLYEWYPDDDEVGAFYAVSAARALGDHNFRLEVRAGAIGLAIFGRNPDHLGAPHYSIHAFDDQIHAPLALSAARRYAEIAPAVSHARHMSTHIFIQHGIWDLVSTHNQSAYDAAQALWDAGESVGDAVHSLDWGQYGNLQRGDYAKARTWIARLQMIIDKAEGAGLAVTSLPLLRARYVVETEEWKVGQVTAESSPHQLLAGRRMSRAQARRSVRGRSLIEELRARGVHVRAAGMATVAEEMPEAYKNVADVVAVMHDAGISTRVAQLRPIGVIKG